MKHAKTLLLSRFLLAPLTLTFGLAQVPAAFAGGGIAEEQAAVAIDLIRTADVNKIDSELKIYLFDSLESCQGQIFAITAQYASADKALVQAAVKNTTVRVVSFGAETLSAEACGNDLLDLLAIEAINEVDALPIDAYTLPETKIGLSLSTTAFDKILAADFDKLNAEARTLLGSKWYARMQIEDIDGIMQGGEFTEAEKESFRIGIIAGDIATFGGISLWQLLELTKLDKVVYIEAARVLIPHPAITVIGGGDVEIQGSGVTAVE